MDEADVSISLSKSGNLWHLEAISNASEAATALRAVQLVYETFTSKFESWVRAEPSATSERDFDTKLWRHRGYVRFSFEEHAGPVHAPEQPANLASIRERVLS